MTPTPLPIHWNDHQFIPPMTTTPTPTPEPQPAKPTALGALGYTPPMRDTTPYTIRTIIQQLGRGLNGALVYVGAHKPTYFHPLEYRDSECRSSFRSHVGEGGVVKFEVGLWFRVNGKQRQGWAMIVAYEPDDTYSVWLVRNDTKAVLAHHEDMYCDTLKSTVEQTYDYAIKEHCQGFIPC